MAKRKLTNQQSRRVKKRRVLQQKTEMPGVAVSGEQLDGLVITNFGKKVLVEGSDGERYTCFVRQHLGKLVAGDHVIWQKDLEPGTGIINQVLERQTLLSRPGFRGEIRMIAANITQIGVVSPIIPGIHPDMIDRYLIASEQIGIDAFIILNKVDLVEEEEHWDAIGAVMLPYHKMGIPIVLTSCVKEHGLDDLQRQLGGETSVLVGPSGAGKSSLIKTLIPDLEIRIGELSAATGLGSHTTSNSILYHLPAGGDLIDSPGVRLFSPQPCSLSELERYYPDFEPFLGQCRFNNCSHTHEPGCAIVEAIEKGKIADQRLHSFHRLLREFDQSKQD